MVSEYEKQKALNIKRNEEILRHLGLHQPLFEPVQKPTTVQPAMKKRKPTAEVEESKHTNKAPRLASEEPSPTGVRRSSRTAGKKVDYTSEQQKSAPRPVSYDDEKLRPDTNIRKYDPKTFGSIPGIEVGAWWTTRMACSGDSIHAPTVAGISGGPEGAYSVALSGGYEDDVDLGYAFTYTGSGGRDLKGTKANPKNLRTAPQSSDQTFENSFNKALKRSCETGKPIRVVRGFKLRSKYAPLEGYRYDGLYKVERAWIEQGLNAGKYLVCKFAFKRLPGQPPLPVRPVAEATQAQGEDPGDGQEQQTSVGENIAVKPKTMHNRL